MLSYRTPTPVKIAEGRRGSPAGHLLPLTSPGRGPNESGIDSEGGVPLWGFGVAAAESLTISDQRGPGLPPQKIPHASGGQLPDLPAPKRRPRRQPRTPRMAVRVQLPHPPISGPLTAIPAARFPSTPLVTIP